MPGVPSSHVQTRRYYRLRVHSDAAMPGRGICTFMGRANHTGRLLRGMLGWILLSSRSYSGDPTSLRDLWGTPVWKRISNTLPCGNILSHRENDIPHSMSSE